MYINTSVKRYPVSAQQRDSFDEKWGNQNFIFLDRPGIDKKQRAALYNEQHILLSVE